MFSPYQLQALRQSIEHEGVGESHSLTRCVLGVAIVTLLCVLVSAVALELHAESVRILACVGVLEDVVAFGF